MKKKTKKILYSVGVVLSLGVAIASDILVKQFYGFIDEGLNGTGIEYTPEAEKVLAKGDAFVSEIMKEGITMLKNTSGSAPFAYDENNPEANRKVNIFGWNSTDAGFLISGYGSGISRIPENKRVLLYQGFDKYNSVYKKKKIEYNTNLKSFYESWCTKKAVTESLGGNDKLYTNYEPKVNVYNDTILDNGKTLLEDAKEYSDSAIIVISRQSGEAQDCPQDYSYIVNEKGGSPKRVDRGYLSLTDEELDLLNMVSENFSNVTVLLNCTNMVECGAFENEKINNVYYIGATGQSGAKVIPMVLTGDVNPSGRITETCVTDHSTNPTFYNAGRKASTNSIVYLEDIYMGYKWYETANVEGYWDGYSNSDTKKSNGKTGYDGVVQYPFGYGLSYTSFDWKIEAIEGKEAIIPSAGATLTKDSKIEINVKVTNTGTVAGKDVVELYYTAPYLNGIEKSSINLGDYAKTGLLKPGESEIVTLSIDAYDMASYDAYDKNENGFKGYELDGGEYKLKLLRNVHETPSEDLTIKYNVDAKGINFEVDPNSKNEVKNRFTDEGCSNNIPIDGNPINGDKTYNYLTRKDFKNTFPNSTAKAKTTNGAITSEDNEKFAELPKFGENHDLYLYTDKSGNKLSESQLKSPDGNVVSINKELFEKLGADYKDPLWDTFLDQLTTEDAIKLVVMGGYSTAEAESVGKIWLRDNDGPMGLTRSNASITETSKWTWFPMAGLIGNSWNKQLAYDYGKTVAAEGAATGVHGWYAPGANIRRSPFGGRNNEYYSEDPVLSGYSAAYTVLGALEGNMAPYIKHFALNETETLRGSLYTWATEQNIRENYLRPFEIAVKKGKANGIMSAFNRVGSVWAGANHGLLTNILRDEWGFNGSVVTDWMGGAGNAAEGLASGNDLWLNGAQNMSHNLGSNWSKDVLRANRVRRACKNILFQLCNTQYIYNHAENNTGSGNKIISVNRPKPYWLFAVAGINIVLVDLAFVFVYQGFIKKGNDKNEKDLQKSEN